MAKGALRSVLFRPPFDGSVCSQLTANAGPRTLCNACGLVYAKLVRQKVSTVVPYHLQTLLMTTDQKTEA